MKFFKNTLFAIALCSCGLISARAMSKATTTEIRPPKTREQEVQIQPIQIKEKPLPYRELVDLIKNDMSAERVLNNNIFTDDFIVFVHNNTTSPASPVLVKSLLQAGASFHARFTGNREIDSAIVKSIKDQIDRQINALRIEPAKGPNLQEWLIIKKMEGIKHMYLVPTDAPTLRKYDLCPLFTGPAYYFVFKENRLLSSGERSPGFEGEDVAMNAPCFVPLGKFFSWNRTLLQLKSLNQFDLADLTGLSPALCAGHSLNNGRLIRKYVLTGDSQCLTDLHNVNEATNFLLDLKIGDWLNVDVVRANIERLGKDLGIDGIDVSAVSTVTLFDSNLANKPEFVLFDKAEFDYVQNVKQSIQKGIRRDNYVHIMIIGNEETVEKSLGHYFCFAIIKAGKDVQYVVLDTIPSAYHLQEGSHERNRLMFLIENIELGNSWIKVPNIRTKLYLKNLAEINKK